MKNNIYRKWNNFFEVLQKSNCTSVQIICALFFFVNQLCWVSEIFVPTDEQYPSQHLIQLTFLDVCVCV